MTKHSWIRRVALWGVLGAGLSAGAFLGGRAYLARQRDEARFAAVHAQRPTALRELRASETARLHAGGVPIEAAMDALATKGREGLGRALTPQPSSDLAPLVGWVYQPHEVPEWMMAADAGTGQAQ
jgi:hypothetical protein